MSRGQVEEIRTVFSPAPVKPSRAGETVITGEPVTVSVKRFTVHVQPFETRIPKPKSPVRKGEPEKYPDFESSSPGGSDPPTPVNPTPPCPQEPLERTWRGEGAYGLSAMAHGSSWVYKLDICGPERDQIARRET